MHKSDLMLGAFFLVLGCCVLNFASGLPSGLQVFPRMIAYITLVTAVIFLIMSAYRYFKYGRFINDWREMFRGFEHRQFFFLLYTVVIYVIGIYLLGFAVPSLLYIFVVMHRFPGVRKWHYWTLVLFLPVVLSLALIFKWHLPWGIAGNYLMDLFRR